MIHGRSSATTLAPFLGVDGHKNGTPLVPDLRNQSRWHIRPVANRFPGMFFRSQHMSRSDFLPGFWFPGPRRTPIFLRVFSNFPLPPVFIGSCSTISCKYGRPAALSPEYHTDEKEIRGILQLPAIVFYAAYPLAYLGL
jgi:hypothetical protein